MLGWVARIGFVVVTTFVIMELGARFLLGLHPLTIDSNVWTHDDRRGWVQQPGAEEQFVRLGFSQHVKINARGLREREIPYERTPGLFRILVIGDSQVVGFEVPPEQVFTRVLEDELNAAGYRVEVINGGCRGYGTDQALLFLMDEGMKYRPDLVLYYWNKNDRENNITVHKAFRRFGKSYFYVGPDRSLELRGVPVPEFGQTEAIELDAEGEPVDVGISLGARVRLWVRDYTAGNFAIGAALLHTIALVPELIEPIRALGATDDLAPNIKGFDRDSYPYRQSSRLVEEMVRVSEAGGARFAMIGLGGRWAQAMAEDFELTRLDDFIRFRASVPEGEMTNVPYDPHLNALGHELYAKALMEELVEHGLVTK